MDIPATIAIQRKTMTVRGVPSEAMQRAAIRLRYMVLGVVEGKASQIRCRAAYRWLRLAGPKGKLP